MDFVPTLESLRAVGEETRLRIVALLRSSDLTVTEIVRCLDQLQPRVSRHLKILVEAGVVNVYQEGAWRFYSIAMLPDWLWAMIEELEGPELAADREVLQEVRRERADRATAYFAENADGWDAVRRLHVDSGEIERALLELAPPRFENFLDLGTGTGRMLTLFADRYNEGFGFDMSPEMLAVARVRLDEAGLRNVELRRRDILKADQLAAEQADIVCLHHVLHFLGEPERAIAAGAMALRPGGSLLIADFAPHTREELRELHAHRRLGFGTDEIVKIARRFGLTLEAERALQPDSDDGLVSKIWRLDKPMSRFEEVKEEALHA
ncbi:MAG: metalloregulator ArsR/SmtB family transcription factor [Pseudomonadota bacterium]